MAHNATLHKEFQHTIVETAELLGYTTMGVFPLLDSHRVYRTPTTLKGWPDLTLIRPPRVLYVEVKTGTGRLRDDQRAVLSLLALIPTNRTAVIHFDDDWQQVLSWLRRPYPAPPVLGYRPMEDPARFLAQASKRDRARTTARTPWPKW